jgi:hypothetical protein
VGVVQVTRRTVPIRVGATYLYEGKVWRLERVAYGIGQVYLRNVDDDRNNAAVAIPRFHEGAALEGEA